MTAETTDTTTPARRSRRRTIWIAAIAVLVVAAVVAAVLAMRAFGSTPAEAVPATVPVALRASHVPDGTKIGVVITLGSGEGSEWNEAAQGALVAERRFAMGGTDVLIVTKADGGTAAGAKSAVESLVDDGVSGIVVASSGAHVSGAVAAADTAGVPVVLPYASASGDAWSTAPTAVSTASALDDALAGAESTLLVDLGGGAPAGVHVAHVLSAGGSTDDTALATTIAQRTGAATDDGTGGDTGSAPAAADSDAVLLSGSAAREASVVAALQAADVTAPVVLTSDATSPAFAAALVGADGSLSASLTTVGSSTGDASALSGDAAGRAMSAFLGGVRVLADDQDAENLTGDQSFSAVAWAADARSHDAVVALVRAVAAARSTDAAEVTDALATLRLGTSDGIAGPALDFRKPQAVRRGAVVLTASAQSLGLRPATSASTPQLVWFAEGKQDADADAEQG